MKLSDAALLELGFDRKAFMLTPMSTSYDHEIPTHVYVMAAEHYHKIGIATDVTKRREAMQLHCPLSVSVVHTIRWPSRLIALLVEQTTHRVLRPYRVHGEWFAADLPTIKRVLLPIAAAARVLREQHMLEWKRRRIAWEIENPHWRELGEDNMRIDATIMGRPAA